MVTSSPIHQCTYISTVVYGRWPISRRMNLDSHRIAPQPVGWYPSSTMGVYSNQRSKMRSKHYRLSYWFGLAFRHGTSSATVIAGNGSNESLTTRFSPLQLVPRRINASASESFVTIPLFPTAVICILDIWLGPPTCFSLDSRFFCNHTVSPHIKKLSKNCRYFPFLGQK